MLGLIGEPGRDIRSELTRFLEVQGYQPLAMQSGQASMHHPQLHPWARVGDTRVLLVGDAAGQVKVTTVGGTLTGFRGAQAAAQAIQKQRPYAQTLKPLQRELDLHWYIRSLLERLDNPGYDRLLQNISPGVKRFLGKYNRDQMAKHFWKLPFIQPGFIPMGIRMLLSTPQRPPLHELKAAGK